jgi:hypothetical protein
VPVTSEAASAEWSTLRVSECGVAMGENGPG